VPLPPIHILVCLLLAAIVIPILGGTYECKEVNFYIQRRDIIMLDCQLKHKSNSSQKIGDRKVDMIITEIFMTKKKAITIYTHGRYLKLKPPFLLAASLLQMLSSGSNICQMLCK
jgi:hypothetical protein